MSDTLDERRALGMVEALTEKDTAACSDCGGEIDVSDANNAMSVVMALENHRQTHSENNSKADPGGDQ